MGSKIIERESGIKPKSDLPERKFRITPDAVLGWEPEPEPIKDPKIFERVTKLVNEELKNFFRPEFLNRLDEIIVFRQLTRDEVKQIAEIMLKEVFVRMNDKGIKLTVTEAFKERLVEEGYNPAYGARPLRRAVMRLLEDSLAEEFLSGKIVNGDSAEVDVDVDKITKEIKEGVFKIFDFLNFSI